MSPRARKNEKEEKRLEIPRNSKFSVFLFQLFLNLRSF